LSHGCTTSPGSPELWPYLALLLTRHIIWFGGLLRSLFAISLCSHVVGPIWISTKHIVEPAAYLSNHTGMYDGTLGVIGAIEAMAELKRAVRRLLGVLCEFPGTLEVNRKQEAAVDLLLGFWCIVTSLRILLSMT
jgi:hypothetical protein